MTVASKKSRQAKVSRSKVAAKKPAPPKHPYMINQQSWNRQLVLDIVCNKIASSSKSISTILGAGHEGHSLPDYATFARWLGDEDDPDTAALRDQYARAKQAQADFMAEEMAELHEKAWVPILDENGNVVRDGNGEILRTVNKASIAAARLEAENKKWLMGKLRPKKYGDKVDVNHGVAPTDPLAAMIARIGLGGSKLQIIDDPDAN